MVPEIADDHQTTLDGNQRFLVDFFVVDDVLAKRSAMSRAIISSMR